MPKLFSVGPYSIYFWSNESAPLEPVHVHISEGRATENATKVWITSTGKVLLCNNRSRIPARVLKKLLRIIESNSESIMERWLEQFGEIEHYC